MPKWHMQHTRFFRHFDIHRNIQSIWVAFFILPPLLCSSWPRSCYCCCIEMVVLFEMTSSFCTICIGLCCCIYWRPNDGRIPKSAILFQPIFFILLFFLQKLLIQMDNKIDDSAFNVDCDCIRNCFWNTKKNTHRTKKNCEWVKQREKK